VAVNDGASGLLTVVATAVAYLAADDACPQISNEGRSAKF
jgi:hypothetical protein